MSLELVPITFAEAKAFVARHHRHNPAIVGHKYSIAVAADGNIRGVIVVGRPVARHLDDGWTLEVNRSCTDGTKNANSILYAAAWRVARNLGYRRLITYVLQSESQTTMKAVGWKRVGETSARSWTCTIRPRVDKHTISERYLYEAM